MSLCLRECPACWPLAGCWPVALMWWPALQHTGSSGVDKDGWFRSGEHDVRMLLPHCTGSFAVCNHISPGCSDVCIASA